MKSRAFLWASALFIASFTSYSQQPPKPGQSNAATPARRVNPIDGTPEYDQDAVGRGQKIFQSNCQFCHGANAKGGEGGPDLLRSITVLHDQGGDLIGEVVHNGRPDKGMPKFALTDDQVKDIATFLHQKVKDAAERGTYQILNIVTGDAKKGEAYFNGEGHCTGCHSVTGDLAHIAANMNPVDIQQHIVMPRSGGDWMRHSAPSPKQQITAEITLPSGETVRGGLAHIDDFEVAIMTPDGDYRSFKRDGDVPKVVLHDPLQFHTEMLSKYTDADIHNLTAYLVTLK